MPTSLLPLSRFKWLWVLLVPSILMLPVLVWPHYGLFSDAGQLIEFPRKVIAEFPGSLALFKPLEDGRWNPLFHGLSVFIYTLAPNNPRIFYIAQWLMLLGASASLVWIVYRATASRLLAVVAMLLLCSSSSFFENFYTLDKVEPRVSLFLAIFLVSLAYVVFDGRLKKETSWAVLLLQLLTGIGMVFSKETGIFLAGALFVAAFAASFSRDLGPAYRSLAWRLFAVQLIVAAGYLALFKGLSPPMSYRYVRYGVTPELVLENVRYYLMSSPELAVGMLLSVYWSVQLLWRRLPRVESALQFYLYVLSFSLMAYFAGICLWRSSLDYFLLPAHLVTALLIPLSIYTVARPSRRLSGWIAKAVLAASVLCWIVFFVARVLVGISIYAFDAVKDDLAKELALAKYADRRVVLPFSYPMSAEVGERLKFFINRERTLRSQVELFNFWEFPSIKRRDISRFDDSAGPHPSHEELAELAKTANGGVALWQFGGYPGAFFSGPEKAIWRFRFLDAGDLIILPVGSSELRWVSARGVGIHSGSSAEFLKNTPLRFKRVNGVSRGIGPWAMGWDVLEVQSKASDGAFDLKLFGLKQSNRPVDIVPEDSTAQLFGEDRLPAGGVLLENGWYGLEGQGSTRFRWMSAESSLVLTTLPKGRCSISMRVDPMLGVGVSGLELTTALGKSRSVHHVSGPDKIVFNFHSTGEALQTLQLTIEGGAMSPPPNDSRLLKMRVFSVGNPQCG